jgi:N,N-dimethylformamidase
MYTIDSQRLDLAREFKAKPFGEHSPDLQYLLNLMRAPANMPFHVLVMTEPHRRWTLAAMSPGAAAPPRLTNTVFTSLEAAEWHVFKLRWKALSGEDLTID